MVVATPTQLTLDTAKTNGISVIGSISLKEPETIRSADRHPALRGWYLSDEPDMHLIAPWQVANLNAELHHLSRKPSLVVLMSGSAAEKYRDSAELIGVDWYPVPWAPVATVAREMRLARLGMQGRPFFAIIQAFDWASDPELVRTDTPLRKPTPAEIRCMTYLALTQGVAGLLFYTYQSDRWNIREHPEIWDVIGTLAREAQQKAALFANRVNWWPLVTTTHGAPAEMYNEIMEARILLSLFHLEKPSGDQASGYYMIAINTAATSTDLSFKLPFDPVESVAVSSAGVQLSLDGRWLRKKYEPFEVCIFGPIQKKLRD